MISLKKYLEMDVRAKLSPDPAASELLVAALESYRSVLLAMGASGARACQAVGSNLQQSLESLEKRFSSEQVTPDLVKQTEQQVEAHLQQWGEGTAEHFKAKANEVKELLLVLARTAESVGERDQRYSNQFSQFTSRLKTIADLDDLTQVRASLVKGAAELKNYVDQMSQDSQKSVAQLRAEVSTYESKLKVVEELAAKDPLTGLSNRRSIEQRLEWRVEHRQGFCVVMLDLNQFKPVNDKHGHNVGDSLLKQFSAELRSNLRSGDMVGRWGGDEFIVVLDCDLTGAKAQVERMQKWVFGEYSIPLGSGAGELKVIVQAAVGVAQWQSDETVREVIERADSAMYRDKQLSGKQRD